jgi:hypothetical protein
MSAFGVLRKSALAPSGDKVSDYDARKRTALRRWAREAYKFFTLVRRSATFGSSRD